MNRHKPYQSFSAVAAQLLLPITLLLMAAAAYFYLESKNTAPHPVRPPFGFSGLLPETTTLLSDSKPDNSVRFLLNATSPRFRVISDSEMLVARLNGFSEQILSTPFITGREIRDAGALLTVIQKIQPEKVEIQRTLSGLKNAIDAGAVEESAGGISDNQRLRDEISFRKETVFPFYASMLSDLAADIDTLQETARNGISALEEYQQISPLIPGWEERIALINDRLRDANYKLTEARNLLKTSDQRTDTNLEMHPPTQGVRLLLEQAQSLFAETDRAARDLKNIILKVLPEPGLTCERIDLARTSVAAAPAVLQLSRVLASSVSNAVTCYRIYSDQLVPKLLPTALEVKAGEQLLETNRRMVSECRVLCNVLGQRQITNLVTLPPHLKGVIRAISSFHENRERARVRYNYLSDALAVCEQGGGFLSQPDGVRFLTPERRPATVTVTLYDRISSAPLPEGSVRIAEHPAQRVTDLKDGRYTFKTLEKETLTIEAGCSGYEATVSTLAVDPKVRKDYTLSITLQRVGKPEEILYPFLPPGTDIDARVNGELIFMNKLLEKYASDAHIIHEIKMRSENRMQLLRSGLEPGGYTLPEGVEP